MGGYILLGGNKEYKKALFKYEGWVKTLALSAEDDSEIYVGLMKDLDHSKLSSKDNEIKERYFTP